jgi:hypothetical protein
MTMRSKRNISRAPARRENRRRRAAPVQPSVAQVTPLDTSAGQIKRLHALELKLVGLGEKAQTSLVQFDAVQVDSPVQPLVAGTIR